VNGAVMPGKEKGDTKVPPHPQLKVFIDQWIYANLVVDKCTRKRKGRHLSAALFPIKGIATGFPA